MMNPNSICIMRLSAIGDVCHTLAMVQAIQRQYPDCAITWVVGKVEANLLEGVAGVQLVVFDKSAGWAGYRALWHQLKDQQFDVLLHMQVALRASVATFGIKAKIKLGFDRARAKEGQWLFTNAQIEPQTEPHVLDGFMGFAQAIGVKDLTPTWQFALSESDFVLANRHITQPTLVICPAASKAERNWLPERYAQVADYATKRGLKVVLCGGPSPAEHQLAAQICQLVQQPITNLVGQTSLKQLLAIVKQATVVLAPDTGPAHMAVTQGTPVIGLYAHSNPKRTGPYYSQQWVVSCYQHHIEQQKQKPLAKIPFGTRAKGQDLMSDIQQQTVTDILDNIINQPMISSIV